MRGTRIRDNHHQVKADAGPSSCLNERVALGLYIHIPFCLARCSYCDFNSYAHLEHLHQPYVRALCAELRQFGQTREPLLADTIYLGGGTPTSIPWPLLVDVIGGLQASFALADDLEITVEANPGTVTPECLAGLCHVGMNRLSLGAQSFHEQELRLMGRIHTAEQIEEAVSMARGAGIDNINLDLIYGLPRQTLRGWLSTVDRALALHPQHLSLYALSVEEGTPLAEGIVTGQLPVPDPDLAADMYIAAEERLAEAHYEHYELSNWAWQDPASLGDEECVPPSRSRGMRCRHNLKYWHRHPYLGFGAGAHSHFGGRRYRRLCNPQQYVWCVESAHTTIEYEEWVDAEEAMAETMILGLRLIEGVRFDDFRQQHGCEIGDCFASELKELEMLNLLALDAAAVRLTARGRLLGNQVFGCFWPPRTPEAGPSPDKVRASV